MSIRRWSLLFALALAFVVPAKAYAARSEYVIVVGGPSLKQWEQYKVAPHDHWWANFVHAARLRTEQIQSQSPPDTQITWLVYRQGYIDRAQQEKQDLISLIESVRDKFHINIVWFQAGSEVIYYLNSGQARNQVKVSGFEFFGHSNKACFMFDYSSNIDSACKSWLHEGELHKIERHIFARNAYIKSWGCHTGESMSKKWLNATGTHMIGAIGKTQFMMEELPILTSEGGHWVF
jgi:hypothetical protein